MRANAPFPFLRQPPVWTDPERVGKLGNGDARVVLDQAQAFPLTRTERRNVADLVIAWRSRRHATEAD